MPCGLVEDCLTKMSRKVLVKYTEWDRNKANFHFSRYKVYMQQQEKHLFCRANAMKLIASEELIFEYICRKFNLLVAMTTNQTERLEPKSYVW